MIGISRSIDDESAENDRRKILVCALPNGLLAGFDPILLTTRARGIIDMDAAGGDARISVEESESDGTHSAGRHAADGA
jgi:hypothetical protein